MAGSFFFYDLETSGINPHESRIMQFAGVRTDSSLKPIGEPVNILITLAGDVLPDPDAIMITGITPQSTLTEGMTEAEFLRFFYEEVVTPDTTFLGYNSVRFDDEFMRTLHYRNFYDPYEWQWKSGCSRWDVLDLVRMTRALRPEGIAWPVTDQGKPTNRLELLTVANKLEHEQAHDALSDVYATIAIAELIKTKQPDLFSYLFDRRSKKQVAQMVQAGQPFVYTSGRYPGQYLHTTAVTMIAQAANDSALVYDLRYDPRPFMAMSVEQLVDTWRYKKDRPDDFVRLPVKTLKYNRCPAVAPLGVIKDDTTQKRLSLTIDTINENLGYLRAGHAEFATKLGKAVALLDKEREAAFGTSKSVTSQTVDTMIYGGFVSQADKQAMQELRSATSQDINQQSKKFSDARLQQLAPLYKARNYPRDLTSEERQVWDAHVQQRLFAGGQHSRLSQYFARLQELAAKPLTSQQEYVIEELQLYGESIMPSDITEQ